MTTKTEERPPISEDAHTIEMACLALVKAIAFHPEEIEWKARQMGEVLALEIRPSQADIASLVGKRGAHASALKRILEEAGRRTGLRVVTTLLEPTGDRTTIRREFQRAARWDSKPMKIVLNYVCDCFYRLAYEIDAEDLEEVTLMQIKPSFSELDNMSDAVMADLALLVGVIGKSRGRVVELATTTINEGEADENRTGRRDGTE